jgi:hypothetical protein
VRALGRRALFGTDQIGDLEGLARATEHLRVVWGTTDAELEPAAALGDRLGVGLPGTVGARVGGETVIDHVAGLPPPLLKLLTAGAPVISPRESLKRLLLSGVAKSLPLTHPNP